MAWEPGTLAPPEVSAQVEALPAGTRITLRPHGAGRWIGVGFLLVWLGGWAVGELFALGFLLAIAGASLGIPLSVSLPTGAAALVVAAFLLVWLIAWTAAGAGAIFALLRLAWGADVITVGPEGWSLRHGIGAWGHCRRFRPGQIQRLALRRRDGALIAEQDGRTITLTTYGALADRRWLLGLLCDATGLPAGEAKQRFWSTSPSSVPPAGTALEESTALPGYQIELVPDGRTRVARSTRFRAGQAGCLLFLMLVWNGVIGILLLARFGYLPGQSGPFSTGTPLDLIFWLSLPPFVLVGLALLLAFLWSVFGREEWLLGPDLFEVRRSIPGRTWARQFSRATLALDVCVDSDGDKQGRLLLRAPGEERLLDRGDPATLRALGSVLARATGWRLQEPDETG